jgi:hypothetical protein
MAKVQIKVRPRARRVDIILPRSNYPVALTPAEARQYAEDIVKAAEEAAVIMEEKFAA